MQAYHGTPETIEKWNLDNIGKTTGTSGGGFGVYFTTAEDEAQAYGANVYTVDLQLGRGVCVDYRTLSKNDIKAILTHYESVAEYGYVENYSNFNEALNVLNESDTDTEIIGDLCNATGDIKGVLSSVVACGYSHAITNGFSTDTNGKLSMHYIVFDVNIINQLNS